MIQYLILLIDSDAPSFCYYDASPGFNAPKRIDIEILRHVIRIAHLYNLKLNVLTNGSPLPPEYCQLLDEVVHISLSKQLQTFGSRDDIWIIDDVVSCLRNDKVSTNCRHIVSLRIKPQELEHLPEFISTYRHKTQRINIHLLDISRYSDAQLALYRDILLTISKQNGDLFSETSAQVNIITDPIDVCEMHNCNPGIEHLTVAPDGNYYICPGFYYDGEQPCGNVTKVSEFGLRIESLSGIDIKNRQLLRLDHAPLCRRCNAYHCKRCIWLNKRSTREVNTPSRAQCIASHYELESARHAAFEQMGIEFAPVTCFDPIEEIDKVDW